MSRSKVTTEVFSLCPTWNKRLDAVCYDIWFPLVEKHPVISKTNALSTQPTTVFNYKYSMYTVDPDVGHMIDTVNIIKSVIVTIL